MQFITYIYKNNIFTFQIDQLRRMRPQDNFNIITGEVKRAMPINSTSKRFQSLDLIKKQKIAGGYDYNMPAVKKLGKAKDEKMFAYTYTGNDPINTIYKTRIQSSSPNILLQSQQQFNNRTISQPRESLVNATKLEYNIISNTYKPNNNAHSWAQTKRRFPISKFLHEGRTYAPNYTQGYQQRENDKEFARKSNLCSGVCEIQKTYGTGKFFRKFK